jgi:hypothetical protein
VSCVKEEVTPTTDNTEGGDNAGAQVPEGYFVATFSTGGTRALNPIEGADGRIQTLKYIVFKSTGEYVKERKINVTGTWPLADGVIRDTLPIGSYKAVFLGNVDPTLFASTDPLVTGYQTGYANARISLPPQEFSSNTEYYMATTEFNEVNFSPNIVLQRILTNLQLKRVNVNAQEALNTLRENIVDSYRNVVTNTLHTVLDLPLTTALGLAFLGDSAGLTATIDAVVAGLVGPILENIIDPYILTPLINDLASTLNSNTNDEQGILAILQPLLNPWLAPTATAAVATINDFPKAVNFDRTVTDYFADGTQFVYMLDGGDLQSEKSLAIKGFATPNGVYDVQKINVMNRGLIGGLVFDNIVEGGLLLDGTFIDITDPLSEADNFGTVFPATNRFYKSDYAFLSLGLNDYGTANTNGTPLNIKIDLGKIGDIDELLAGLPVVGDLSSGLINIISGVLSDVLGLVPIALPINNLPLLGLDNLSLSGGWTLIEEPAQP